MKIRSAECRSVRNRLLDLALAAPLRDGLPPDPEEHFRSCPACSIYRDGLRAIFAPPAVSTLYTPELRGRTLAAARRGLDRPSWLAPLLLPVSAISLAASLLAPIWLLTALLDPFLGSPWVSWGFSLLLTSSAGLTAAGLGLALLIRQREAGFHPATNGRSFREVLHG
jgi:hypothetical protein